MRGGLTVAGVVAFAALLYWMTLQQGGVECEVCMESDGGVFCSTVVAATREQAIDQGRNKACGVMTTGMSAELACQRGAPHRATCTE
jgi:hypothetical protein